MFGPTTRARWSYGASKAIDEFLALAYWRERKLPVVVGRLFNVVGPRQTGAYGMVLPRLSMPPWPAGRWWSTTTVSSSGASPTSATSSA